MAKINDKWPDNVENFMLMSSVIAIYTEKQHLVFTRNEDGGYSLFASNRKARRCRYMHRSFGGMSVEAIGEDGDQE